MVCFKLEETLVYKGPEKYYASSHTELNGKQTMLVYRDDNENRKRNDDGSYSVRDDSRLIGDRIKSSPLYPGKSPQTEAISNNTTWIYCVFANTHHGQKLMKSESNVKSILDTIVPPKNAIERDKKAIENLGKLNSISLMIVPIEERM